MAKPVEKPGMPAPAPRRGFPFLLVLVCLLLGAGGGAGGWYFLSRNAAAHAGAEEAPAHEEEGHDAPKRAKGSAEYVSLEPAFVVNLADGDAERYLQTDIQLLLRGGSADAVKQHAPQIRNNLLLLFAQQTSAGLRERGGREKLQADALAEVRKVLETETGKPMVEALYFTSFVMQ
ncbi:flagellar basal body-associated FliL family protein [Tahibacter soli]|jgi:flagellar FliL protein|uniref:Flagellar protein FliL n=1 Tax=Tahibacter soli TaxID=2983605 RepID=A0A9X4BK61_9GAMM|nr:flagellar basal body-associated FliL family protein [Tahibacter soli]MDC8012869.1 flagellar basal body-associated FliL family protein [Tahibacter soli]